MNRLYSFTQGDPAIKTLSLLALVVPLLLLAAAPALTGDAWILGALRDEFNPQISSINKNIELPEKENLLLRNEMQALNRRITRLEAFHPSPAPNRPR